jgi:rare lipoprotein A
MPDAVVTTSPISPTGIFVQAGSFSVYENARNLGKKLNTIAPANVDEVVVNGRKLYRVKLGPIASVQEADRVLSRVAQAGYGTGKVIRP